MPSRFSPVARVLPVLLLLAGCEQDAQETAEVDRAREPATAEVGQAEEQVAELDGADGGEQSPPADGPADARAAPDQPQEQQATGRAGEDVVVVIPPEEDGAADGGRQTAQAPGEPAPEAAGVASVAAYVGRWAEEPGMCEDRFWTFTNLRLQSPGDLDCDIQDTAKRDEGLALEVACTDKDRPLAKPDLHTMIVTFPNMPETATMVVRGGPIEDALTLTRCPLG